MISKPVSVRKDKITLPRGSFHVTVYDKAEGMSARNFRTKSRKQTKLHKKALMYDGLIRGLKSTST